MSNYVPLLYMDDDLSMPYTLLQVLLISVTKRNPGLHGLMSRPKIDLVHRSHRAPFTCPAMCFVADCAYFCCKGALWDKKFDGVHCGFCGFCGMDYSQQ